MAKRPTTKNSAAPAKAPRARRAKTASVTPAPDSASDARQTIPADPPVAALDEPPPAPGQMPTEDEIRRHAYLRFLARGGSHGSDFDDWLAAEAELRKR